MLRELEDYVRGLDIDAYPVGGAVRDELPGHASKDADFLVPGVDTLRQKRDDAGSVKVVAGERVGGGLAADGMGELSKLLMGRDPSGALRLARDTGVLAQLLPEFAPSIGFDQESKYHSLTVDEHTFRVVQAAADAGRSRSVRLP